MHMTKLLVTEQSATKQEKCHLTEWELALRWGMDVCTLRTWRRTGYGPPYRKFGSAVRYWFQDIVDFEEKATRASTSDPAPQH